MTLLLDHAVKKVRDLPAEAQNALARMLLQFAGIDQSMIELSQEEAASFDTSLIEEARGEFATEKQITAIWKKHGL
jgi:hypothetical protein